MYLESGQSAPVLVHLNRKALSIWLVSSSFLPSLDLTVMFLQGRRQTGVGHPRRRVQNLRRQEFEADRVDA